jgi:histone deacetylase 1/2
MSDLLEKPNHDAIECWHRYEPSSSRATACGYNDGYPPRQPHYNPYPRPTAHLVIPQHYGVIHDIDNISNASWYPDSGASHNLTFNPNNLTYRMLYQGQDQVLMGNGQGVKIQSLGHSNFQSTYNLNVHLKLNDLLHVPNISKNLLSVNKFAQDNNVVFEFHPHFCYVKSQDTRHILLEGTV